MRRAGRRFFAVDAETLAERLIGTLLVRTLDSGEKLIGRIVETEAYLGVADAASHAFGGRRTARTEPMYGPPGTTYVYFTYGMHHCFNIACGRVDEPPAVLIRAVEPLEGLDTMRCLRRARAGSSRALPNHQLASGPARLCVALGIGPDLNAADITSDPRLALIPRSLPRSWRILAASRVGIDSVAEPWRSAPLRRLVEGHRSVSRRPSAAVGSRDPNTKKP